MKAPHFLLVEDDPDQAFLIGLALRSRFSGCSVETTASYRATVAFLSDAGADPNAGFDVAIVDMHLSGDATGLDVLSWIHRHPESRVGLRIMYSSSPEASLPRRAIEAGALRFVAKSDPSHERLLNTISALLSQPERRDRSG